MKVNKYYKWIESNNGYWYDKGRKVWTFDPTPPFSNVCCVKTLHAAKRRIRKWQKTNPEAIFIISNKYRMFPDIIYGKNSKIS
jgi:hypothetical protein